MALPPLRITVDADTAKAEAGLKRVNQATGKVGVSSVAASGKTRQLSMQLSQVAQQATASGNVMQALAVQAADIGLAFGTAGTIIGAVAGITLPALISSVSGASTGAIALEDALDDVNDALSRTSEIAQILAGDFDAMVERYGLLSERSRELALIEGEISLRSLADASKELNQELTALYDGNAWLNVSRAEDLARGLDLSTRGSRELSQAMSDLANAGSLQEQLETVTQMRRRFVEMVGPVDQMTEAQLEFFTHLVDSERAMELLKQRTDEMSASVGGAADEAERLASSLLQVLNIAPSGVQGGRGTVIPNAGDIEGMRTAGPFFAPDFVPKKKRGGGRAQDRLAGQLDTLRENLATENELAALQHEQQQELLEDALEKRLITQQEFEEMSLRSAQDYRDALLGIDTDFNRRSLGAAGDYLENLVSMTGTNNEKLLKLAKAFGAAQALVDAWRAHNAVLADPSLPWWARAAAAAQVLASGIGAVNAIKSVGSGGAGPAAAGGAGGGATAAAPAPLEARISGVSPDSLFSGASITSLFDALQDEAGDRGLIVSFAT